DDSGLSIDAAYATVASVGDVQVSKRIDEDPVWRGKRSVGRGSTVAAPSDGPVAHDSGNDACGCIHSPDPATYQFQDKQVAGGVNRHSDWNIERRLNGRPGIAVRRSNPVAGHQREDTGYRV